MSVLAAAAFLAALLPAQEDSPLGPKTVNVRNASFLDAPSITRGKEIRPAVYGEKVTVTAVKGSYSKVLLNEGGEAFIASTALIESVKFQYEAANEAEMAKMESGKYASSRFDPETEKKYKEQKGPAIQAAYEQVNALEARSLGTRPRSELQQILLGFRRGGKLGEFSAVK